MSLGEASPIGEQFSLVYEELRRLAHRLKQRDGSLTLNPTALVHEAYLNLVGSKTFEPRSTAHLRHTAIVIMRHLLVDAARRRCALRHGGALAMVSQSDLDESALPSKEADPERMLAISMALDKLADDDALQAQVFECSFFGGLTQAEIAGLFGISDKAVSRNLRLAKAWLMMELGSHELEGEK